MRKNASIAQHHYGLTTCRRRAAVSLYYFAYNFIKIHCTLRTTPAMAAGVTNKLWEVSALVALWEEYEKRDDERAA